jgi:isopenicillin-N N-acyltransferase like protein
VINMAVKYSFPVVECSGSPYEIGYMHGSRVKTQVENTVREYKCMFATRFGADWNTVKSFSRKYIDPINWCDEELTEEIKGIADGAGMEFEEILAINARTEIINRGKATGTLADGCTSFAVLPGASSDGDTIIGQNWDWKSCLMESPVILRILQGNKPDVLMVTEAGLIGKTGFNSRGIGVCFNAIWTCNNKIGVPTHVLLRRILNSHNHKEAVYALCEAEGAGPANYLIAGSGGDAVDIEYDAGDYTMIFAQNGIIAHTNHVIGSTPACGSSSSKDAPDSYIRLIRLKESLGSRKMSISVEHIKEALSDHVGYPDSICRHVNPANDLVNREATLFSVIMNLDKKEMHLAQGQPCCSIYNVLKLAAE